jgi:hypothetical protein
MYQASVRAGVRRAAGRWPRVRQCLAGFRPLAPAPESATALPPLPAVPQDPQRDLPDAAMYAG